MDRGGRALQLLHRPAEVHPAAAAAVLEPVAQLPDPLAMLVGGACVMMCTSMSHVPKHAFAVVLTVISVSSSVRCITQDSI